MYRPFCGGSMMRAVCPVAIRKRPLFHLRQGVANQFSELFMICFWWSSAVIDGPQMVIHEVGFDVYFRDGSCVTLAPLALATATKRCEAHKSSAARFSASYLFLS